MSSVGIASQMGITASALDDLVKGSVPIGVAAKLGTTAASLQDFVNGGTSGALASAMGATPAALQELRQEIGQQGAIGVLIGFCVAAQRQRT